MHVSRVRVTPRLKQMVHHLRSGVACNDETNGYTVALEIELRVNMDLGLWLGCILQAGFLASGYLGRLTCAIC